MARHDQELIDLKDKIEVFSTFVKDKLIHKPEWGSISLEEASQDFERIFNIIGYLKVLPLEVLPKTAVIEIKAEIIGIINLFGKIVQFSIERENPKQQRDAFVAEILTRADALYSRTAQWIPFLAYQKGDVSRNIELLTQSIKDAHHILENTKKDISNKEKEIQEIIIAAREASASAGAAVFTKDFQDESDTLAKIANKWLTATAILAAGTMAASGIMWCYTESVIDQNILWQKISTKFVILIVLITSAIWCGKIYRALMHQASVNRHRALSIQTLKAFSAAAFDESIKDAIVLEATRAVFGNVPTGYIDTPSQGTDGDIKILEIMKSALPKK